MKLLPTWLNISIGVITILFILIAISLINPYYDRELKETCEGYYCGTYSNWTCTSRSGEVIDFTITDRDQPKECSQSSCCEWGLK